MPGALQRTRYDSGFSARGARGRRTDAVECIALGRLAVRSPVLRQLVSLQLGPHTAPVIIMHIIINYRNTEINNYYYKQFVIKR